MLANSAITNCVPPLFKPEHYHCLEACSCDIKTKDYARCGVKRGGRLRLALPAALPECLIKLPLEIVPRWKNDRKVVLEKTGGVDSKLLNGFVSST